METDGKEEISLNYPEELPVSAHRGEILSALRRSQVVVVCGDTGSGKTTQLPKMALEAGFCRGGRLVACTQPRRLAAVTVAERVAAETGTAPGGLVGYRHRFGRRTSKDTKIVFMTDGVLLAETRSDRLLERYGAIIVDEAHERSLNIDFLLGILKRILARRRDLRVIVSSATLDAERFGAFFGGAPALMIPGRLFPIETRYMPPPEDEERDLPREVVRAVAALPPRDDTLVFLPGERDIRETADELSSAFPGDDIIPLLASLPSGEQQRAFRLSSRRRIVLATNVAETSVTIPGIRAVVDSGLARLPRYIHRTQVQRLQVEPVSQASAKQRAGRCGRLGPGVCIRLYSEEDLSARDEFTPPEVLRSSLAGVILTMLDLRLGDIAKFPFIDPPRPAMVAEGIRELIELGAVARDRDGEPCLSPTGRRLARIPVEPRLARMLLAASELATLPSAVPVVAALSCDDPRRRPVDERDRAQQAHAQFRSPESDFLGTLKLWKWWKDRSGELSGSKLRKLCKATYLSFPKMREWSDLARQLAELCARIGLDVKNDNGGPDALHRALLTGLLSRIGRYDAEEREYRGARGLRFAIHPGSALAKRRQDKGDAPPEWIMAGELVDTSRLFARAVAPVDVEWIEAAAGAICKSHFHSPEWDPRSGFVRATEQVTLYGLVIVPARRCDYSRVDPAASRDIFIRRGLVDGDFPHPPPPVRENSALIEALRRRAEKFRRPEMFDEDALAAALDASIPEEVCSAPALAKWLRRASTRELDAFRLKKSDWWTEAPGADGYPDGIRIGGVRMRLVYRNAADDPETDGMTCRVRRSQAAALKLWRSEWLVPGMLPEKLTWMLSVLPTAQRRVLAPISDTVSGLLAKLKPGTAPLAESVADTIYREWGFRVTSDVWREKTPPPHLQARFEILDDSSGRVLFATRDKGEALRFAGVADASAPAVSGPAAAKHSSWDFGDLPETASDGDAGWKVRHFPALRDEGDGVTLRLYADADEAARVHDAGVLRLYLLKLAPKATVKFSTSSLPFAAAMYIREIKYDGGRIAADILAGAVKATLLRGRPPVRSAAEFDGRIDRGMADIARTQSEIAAIVRATFASIGDLLGRIDGDGRIPSAAAEAVQTQLVWFAAPGFPRTTPLESLRRYATYLKGAATRLERARTNPSGDAAKEARFAPYWERYRAAAADRSASRPAPEVLERFRWLLEEFRISLFAQELRTAEPVSEKRLDAIIP
ncbi:MAG: ATP-dependent RNA helicase HrpA [Kiritimatiellae bacterium]|nr:ATP-dependent RNA helicase HrpA [Kiritimatiellia bacterium]